MSRFTITITETQNEEVFTEQTWTQVNPSDTTEPERSAAQYYGYTPQIKTIKNVTRELYKQNADKINLYAIIRAFNEMGEKVT